MITVRIHRKKQLASALVPFNLIVNDDIEKVKNAVKNKNLTEVIKTVNLYPIKSDQTVAFNVNGDSIKIAAINNNFDNNIFYPFAMSEEIILNDNQDLLLEQTKAMVKVKIELNKVNNLENANNIIEHNL